MEIPELKRDWIRKQILNKRDQITWNRRVQFVLMQLQVFQSWDHSSMAQILKTAACLLNKMEISPAEWTLKIQQKMNKKEKKGGKNEKEEIKDVEEECLSS